MVPSSMRVPVPFDFVFPAGCLLQSVEKVTDWEKREKGGDDHARDPESGLRVWQVTVSDLYRDENAPFPRKSFEMTVKVASDHKPVAPSPEIPGYPPKVAFTGITVSPWVDNNKCTGKSFNGGGHRCGAKLAWSIRATGMVAAAELEAAELTSAKGKR